LLNELGLVIDLLRQMLLLHIELLLRNKIRLHHWLHHRLHLINRPAILIKKLLRNWTLEIRLLVSLRVALKYKIGLRSRKVLYWYSWCHLRLNLAPNKLRISRILKLLSRLKSRSFLFMEMVCHLERVLTPSCSNLRKVVRGSESPIL